MDSANLVNHWSEMPEWENDRRLWAVYITFPSDPELHRAVVRYQTALEGMPGLDLIDLRWLHLTMQGIAFSDEVERAAVEEIRHRLLAVTSHVELPPTFEVGHPVPAHDSIMMPVLPGEVLAAVRAAVIAVIEDVLGDRPLYRLPEPVGGFRPHISIAYANTDVAESEIVARLSAVSPAPVELELDHLSLLQLQRRRPRWIWAEECRLPMGESAHGGRRPVPVVAQP